jgi:hypothetical protein
MMVDGAISAFAARMPQSKKTKSTSKQKKPAPKIEEGYERRGISRGEAGRRGYAVVIAKESSVKKSASGASRKKPTRASSRKGAKKGAKARAR